MDMWNAPMVQSKQLLTFRRLKVWAWKQLTERDCRELKLLAIDPHARYTHNFAEDAKKLASASPRDSKKISNVHTFCFLKSTFIFGKSECASGVSVQYLVKPSTGRRRISTVHRFYQYSQIINTMLSSTRGKLSRH